MISLLALTVGAGILGYLCEPRTYTRMALAVIALVCFMVAVYAK